MRVPLFALLFTAASALAAGGPENLVLLLNGDSWASMTIANEYRQMRDIAPDHLVVLHDLPSFERMTVAEFREKVLTPGLQEAERRGLGGQLDYLLYSADFPTAIDVSADKAGKTFPRQITQPAALTGLTFLYKFTLGKNPAYLGLNSNFYFRQVAKATSAGTIPQAAQTRYVETLKRFEQVSQRYETARKADAATAKFTPEELQTLRELRATLEELTAAHPAETEMRYNLACVQARLGDLDAATATLRAAMEHGWFDLRHAQQDPDLRDLRERADFKELAVQARVARFELWPTSGFRGSLGWMPTGQPVPPNLGVRYLLSTQLAYTSGRGNSVPEAIAGLARSAKADGTRPSGTIYYLENSDIRSTTREWGFHRAVEKLQAVGVAAKIETGVLPANKSDVVGLTAGAADFTWSSSGSTILPGAICEHLTSCGGMLHEGDPQTPLTEFLRHGAAGASGTVNEPFALQAKFPTPFLHYHYAQGCTLAEAFYQSVAGPYQLLIVGDALCAPWKKRITVSLPTVTGGITIRGKVSLRPAITSPDNIRISHTELFLDGKRIAMAKADQPLEFDSTAVADGVRELQVVANGNDPIGSSGRLVVPCTIRNGATELSVEAAIPSEIPWDRDLQLPSRAPGAKQIVFRHIGRDIAKIESSSGDARIDLRKLGQGPVILEPIALFENGREHHGPPLRFRIVPPAPLPPQSLPEGKKLADGFHVSSGGETPVVIAQAEGDWLAKAGVKPDTSFTVDAWFTVERDDVYQFQLRGPSTLQLSVDGVNQEWPRGKEWWFVPVSLAKGLHKVSIEAKAEGAPKLDTRFGGPGSYRLSGTRFKHLE